MTHGKKSFLVLATVIIIAMGWFAYIALRTPQHILEAYAAWDTGTLLVEYMKTHNDRWPESWDDLLTVLDSNEGVQIPLRGASAGDAAYARSLREKITVDWNFNPTNSNAGTPVTPLGGGTFSIVWEGAEPNEMIRSYLSTRTNTQPSADP